jgi:inner membrane protein
VDNVTHAFVGAAIGEYVAPTGADGRTRAAFLSVGVLAANIPDVDLLYSGITEQPLGYLLHHRGHSHTWPGLAALGLLIWVGLSLLPRTRRLTREAPRSLVLLIAAALVSHLLLDTANSYGTHLFDPISSRWVYGDAVFVLEPWLWVILGVTLAMNTARLWRALIVAVTFLLIVSLILVGLLPIGVVAMLIAAALAALLLMRRWDRKGRALAVLIAISVFAVTMSGVSRVAKAETRRALTSIDTGEVIDIVADANPGAPWCWTVLTLQRASADPARTLAAYRATVSLVPRIWPAASCASARLATQWSTGEPSSSAVVWHRRWQIDLEQLRARASDDCRVRAWLQFSRVPQIADGRIIDLRFETPIGQNFSAMVIDEHARACPTVYTHWMWPRGDVLGSRVDTP